MFMDMTIYKITEDHSVAVSQTKNDHIQVYLVVMKVKKKLFYEMVNSGCINKGQIDNFVSEVDSSVQEQTIGCQKQRFQNLCGKKAITLIKP